MSAYTDRKELIAKVMQLTELTNDEKSHLVKSLNEEKRYGLVWEEKHEDVETRLAENIPVLQEVKERAIQSDSADAPNHVLIEGDNLEALTALSYTHKGKIDVIYIDPPYNTGNKDFVYNDAYVDKEDRFRHSKWLSFVNKRLKLAKELLSDKGVIFISIDDNEVAQLKLLCDEIFGTRNFISQLTAITNLKGNQDEFGFAGTHEYILVYSKDKPLCQFGQLNVNDEELDDWMEDEFGFYKKGANLKSTGVNAPKEKRPNLFYPILVNKKTNQISTILEEEFSKIYDKESKIHDSVFLDELRTKYGQDNYFLLPMTGGQGMSWRWKMEKVKNEKNDIIVVKTGSEISLYKKQRPELGDLPSKKAKSIFYKPEYSSGNGKAEIVSLFGEGKFGYPKPLSMISDIIRVSNTSKYFTILDFFAGSGTTLHATMQLNAEDGGKRKCILVTNNENKICEDVTYVRNKKVIEGYTTPKGEKVEGLKKNNLRYYKMDYVPQENISVNMRELMEKATDMLCIKHDIYTEVPLCDKPIRKSILRYFEEGDKRMLMIYEEEYVEEIVKVLATKPVGTKPIMTYVFSSTNYAYDEDFSDVSNRVELCALPKAIYNSYKHVKDVLKIEKIEADDSESADESTEEGGEA